MRYQKGRKAVHELNDKAGVVSDMSELCLRMGDMENAELYARDTLQADYPDVVGGTAQSSQGIAGKKLSRHTAESSLVLSRVFKAKQR